MKKEDLIEKIKILYKNLIKKTDDYNFGYKMACLDIIELLKLESEEENERDF